MKFYRFVIIKEAKESDSGEETQPRQEEVILVNVDHIVSIKPIRVMLKSHLYEGHWLRLSNGKKYRALEIPLELQFLLDNTTDLTGKKESVLGDEQTIYLS